jgi:hypothetical protein
MPVSASSNGARLMTSSPFLTAGHLQHFVRALEGPHKVVLDTGHYA